MVYRIRELRDMTGLSQKGFADKYGIPLSTLRKWEQGSAAPAPYVVRLIASTLPATDESSVRVQDGDNIYFFNSEKGTVSDSLGNEISVTEDIKGVNEQNLRIYLRDLFEGFYEIRDRFEKDLKFDKANDVLWSTEHD